MASAEFAASGQGIVVVDASRMTNSCHNLVLQIGTRSSAGENWTAVKAIDGKERGLFHNEGGDKATELTLPAGEYGLLSMSCMVANRRIIMLPKADSFMRNFLLGFSAGRVVQRPLATFSVNAGEVVDIGSISARETSITSFVPIFGPMTIEVRASFEAANPKLASVMVTRLMSRADMPTQLPPAPKPPQTQ
jgi:hypothetical protein